MNELPPPLSAAPTPTPSRRGPPRERTSGLRGRSWHVLGVLLIGAFAARVWAARDIARSVYAADLLWDERVYHEWAAALAAGAGSGSTVYEFAPLPAYVFAAVYRLFGTDPAYLRVLNVLLGTATCGVISVIASRLGTASTAAIAAATAALYGPFVLYSVVPLKEALAIFLFALTGWLALEVDAGLRGLRAEGARSRAPEAALGLVAGLLSATRPNAVVILPGLALLAARRAARHPADRRALAWSSSIVAAGYGVGVLPFMLRNYLVAGSFTFLTSQLGFNLFIGNNPGNSTPYYRPVPFATTSPLYQGVQFAIEASRRVGRALSPEESSAYWTGQVLEWAWAHPGQLALGLVRKLLALLSNVEACDHYHLGFVGRHVPALGAPFLTYGVVLAFAAAGVARGGAALERGRVLLVVGALYAATLVVFMDGARYRVPLLAIAIPFAAAGVEALARAAHHRALDRPGRRAALAAAAVLALAWLPVTSEDLTGAYNTHAFLLRGRGDRAGAARAWLTSAALGGTFSATAELRLAGEWLREGRLTEASERLAAIPETSFVAAAKHDLLGDIAARGGRLTEAAAEYERALAINSGERGVLQKLLAVHTVVAPDRAEEDSARLAALTRFYAAAPEGAGRRTRW